MAAVFFVIFNLCKKIPVYKSNIDIVPKGILCDYFVIFYRYGGGTNVSKINGTPKLSEKLQLTAALCNYIFFK